MDTDNVVSYIYIYKYKYCNIELGISCIFPISEIAFFCCKSGGEISREK